MNIRLFGEYSNFQLFDYDFVILSIQIIVSKEIYDMNM